MTLILLNALLPIFVGLLLGWARWIPLSRDERRLCSQENEIVDLRRADHWISSKILRDYEHPASHRECPYAIRSNQR